MAPATTPVVQSAPASSRPDANYTGALIVLTSLFFMWGLITSLNDILIPHLRAPFELSYVQVMLIQFCLLRRLLRDVAALGRAGRARRIQARAS